MKLSSASLRVLKDLSSGPKRLFYLHDKVYGWNALEKLGLVERFGNDILGWARLTDKGIEYMKSKETIKESKVFRPKDKAFFEYHCFESEKSSDAELWHHNCQWVTVLRKLSPDEVDPEIAGGMYRIKFSDGFEWDVYSDELFRRKQGDCKPWRGNIDEIRNLLSEESSDIIFTEKDAKEVGEILDIDWDEIDIDEFVVGMNVELEHGSENEETNVTDDDPIKTARIVLAHINETEDGKYYSNPMSKNWGKKEVEKRINRAKEE